ncbi:REP element-mobilizing transposase RayT [Bradyrhizobium sp. i1.15.2]
MVRYRRNFVPGGTFFFTVARDDRRSSALVDHVDKLRDAFRMTRADRPFTIDAIVVLPDHLHVIMTLPDNDADFSGRWWRIKSSFTHQLAVSGAPISRNVGANSRCGNGDFGSTPFATMPISNAARTTSITIQSSTALSRHR